MTAITMDKVKLTGIMNIDRVLQFTAHAIANEHAHMYFEGIVAAADGREYMSMPMAGQEMQLKCDVEGTDKPYFAGQVLRAVIAEEGGLFTVKCECISGSYRFDLSKKSRSFQYTPTTYAEMFKWIQDKDKIGNILAIKGADTQIGYPIIQYEETDWEFAKRMAGHFGTVVLPEITDGFPQMSVGVINGNTYEIGENSRYEEGKRIAAYRKKNPVSPCALTDFRTMRVMDYRNFELGDKVLFKGETWIVMGKEIRMVQSLLEVWYVLGLEQGYGLPKHYNAHISGMSILGEVIYTDHENLKIHLDIDEKQDVEKAYKYTWMPATGNLMYCMPKLGTRVSLYMPDSHEGNAYATECVRTNGGTACGEMADYNVRQFLTEHDKRMTMAPASMQFVGSSKENNNIVRLEDEKGLYFDSQQPIYMQSGENFIVSAGGKVNVQSNKNIVVHKSRVKSGFELSGSEVNIYAKKFYRNGQTSGAAGPLAAETASGTPFPFGLMIGALLAMLPFAANPNDDSTGGKQPANTGNNGFGDDFFDMMQKSYGFSQDQASLIAASYTNYMNSDFVKSLSKAENSDGVIFNQYFSNLAALCVNYSGSAFRWRAVSGTPPTVDAVNFFENTCGMSNAQVQDLMTVINRQHTKGDDKMYTDSGICMTAKCNDPECTSPVHPRESQYWNSDYNRNNKDFAHELIQYATFSYPGTNWIKGPFIGSVANSISFKGDVYSGRVDDVDKRSDLDAINVYKQYGQNVDKSIWDVMTAYNLGVADGKTNRANKFLDDRYGVGDIESQLKQFEREMKTRDMASNYVAHGFGPWKDSIRFGVDATYVSPYEVDDFMNELKESYTFGGEFSKKEQNVKKAIDEFINWVAKEAK